MAMAAKRNPARKPDSILDAKRQALAEEQAKTAAEIAKREKLIRDAPRIAAEKKRLLEEAKQAREEAERIRHAKADIRFGPRVLNDPRFVSLEANTAAPRVLRKHRNQGMYLFFVLCVILAAVLCWLYFKVIRAL